MAFFIVRISNKTDPMNPVVTYHGFTTYALATTFRNAQMSSVKDVNIAQYDAATTKFTVAQLGATNSGENNNYLLGAWPAAWPCTLGAPLSPG